MWNKLIKENAPAVGNPRGAEQRQGKDSLCRKPLLVKGKHKQISGFFPVVPRGARINRAWTQPLGVIPGDSWRTATGEVKSSFSPHNEGMGKAFLGKIPVFPGNGLVGSSKGSDVPASVDYQSTHINKKRVKAATRYAKKSHHLLPCQRTRLDPFFVFDVCTDLFNRYRIYFIRVFSFFGFSFRSSRRSRTSLMWLEDRPLIA